ncbi:MAG: arylsulfatase [Acidobacteriia bacterium]|nr:arylsulfatase [Terriglobia bacterium]
MLVRHSARRLGDCALRSCETPMFVRTVVLLLLPALASAAPNIVFMMADDLGWNDVGYHGSEIKTPNIDALVEQGVELDRYYAFPLCSPTRVALMTGRSPIRQGVDSPIGPNGGLPLDEHLLPQTLRAAGYETFMAGKWHLGIERIASHPYRRGFDRSYGHLGAAVDYFTHRWLGGLDWHRNGEVLREEGYSTELITSEALDQLRTRDKSKPMFLYVAFNAPHTPLQATETYLKRYPNVEGNRRLFAAMVSAMDDGVGKILAALEMEGIADDTLVVWVSDNGGGIRAGASNEPFRGGKGSAFEGGIRVPGAVRWNGVLTAGSKLEQQFSAHDWFPTLTSAVGVEPQNVKPFDGVDMWPALEDGTAVARSETVIGVDGNYAIFRDGWKLVEFTPRNSNQTTMHLYRFEDDPSEEHDLIEVKPDLATELLARMRSIPRPPSVSQDVQPRGPRPGAPTKGAPKAKKGRGGRGARDPQAGWPDETREPWIDTALRD